jgi:hypothetical protein
LTDARTHAILPDIRSSLPLIAKVSAQGGDRDRDRRLRDLEPGGSSFHRPEPRDENEGLKLGEGQADVTPKHSLNSG